MTRVVTNILLFFFNMDFITLLTSVAGMIATLGGFELIKWVMNRKSNTRIAEAQADSAEFEVLRKQLIFLQEQLDQKEKRFAEQTDVVRQLNLKEIELTQEIGRLKLELAVKRCEVKKCPKREPQTGY